ncbi:lipocalin-like domain-containing protein [Photobacterium leiognathi]|uniref:lipocalin-like domain-containing protein n=1 Tax=Photobacterium leiognathi TaxID=553611 RepID=UPI00298110A7|nr:lipocalin-like domain-containing protein [Photobacterium leiognathi]
MTRKQMWLTRIVAFLAVLIVLNGCDQPKQKSKSVESLTQSTDYVFEPVVKGEKLAFPKDFGAHPDYLAEWWYFTTNLEADDGTQMALQWALFRMATGDEESKGWKTPQMYMAHAVITTKNKIWRAERFARGGIGQAGVILSPFRAWLDNWAWRAQGNSPFPGRLEFADNEMEAILDISQGGSIILQGEDGYSKKHPLLDIASYYYSAPFLNVKGMVELDGKAYRVKGQGWFDREWSSSMLSKQQQGWDWFSIHLDDGSALMVSQLREKDNEPYFFGSRSWPNGKVVQLDNNQIRMKPVKYYGVQGKQFPLVWEIDIPSQSIKLETQVVRRDQWLPFIFPYWEGPIRVKGSHTGKGFMELTGYE